MALNAHEELAIFIIVYFSLALPASIWVCKKQGLGRSLGWVYLVTLPLFRIAGSACLLAADEQPRPGAGTFEAAAILNGLGLISLELTLLGLVERANAGMQNRFRYATKGLPWCHILLMVAAGLAISGGANSAKIDHPGTVRTGHSLRRVSSMLLLAVFLILVAVTIGIFARLNQAWVGDRRIVQAAMFSFPFFLVRTTYTIIIAFDTDSATFSAVNANVYAQAFMQILMECILMVVFLATGFTVPSMRLAPEDVKEGDPPGVGGGTQAPKIVPGNDVELGFIPSSTSTQGSIPTQIPANT